MRVALTVADFLNRAALVFGQRVALQDEPAVAGSLGTQTYAELEARARGMALVLDDLGVGQGERVAIVSPNSGRFLTAFFGVSGFGRILVPINFRLTTEEIAYVVEHSGASVPSRQKRWLTLMVSTSSARSGSYRRTDAPECSTT